jgi:hypothetical protein
MPINLDQTGPAHLLSTDEDGLILNGSPVISKSIHVSDIEPKDWFGDTNTKLLWLDTGVAGTSVFPLGGAANYILRTDGNGTVSWIPPSSIDATKFHYVIDSNNVNYDPGTGKIKFVRTLGSAMSTSINIAISGYDKSSNLISSFINSLTAYGNANRRGFIKIEKENDPNFFQIYSFSTVTDNTGWFNLAVTPARIEVGDENFLDGDPVSVTFTPCGPEALTQDLTPYVLITGTQTLTNKTLVSPIISGLYLSDSSIVFEGSFPANDFETTLTVENPTADRTVTIPDATTTMVGTDVTQTLTNKTIIDPLIDNATINLTANNTNITLTSDITTAFNSRYNTTTNNQYSWTTNLYYDGTAWLKDDNDRGGWRINKLAATTLDSSNEIAIAYAPIGSNVVANHLVVSGSGSVSLPSNVPSTNTTTGTLIVTGGVGIGGDINTGGDLNVFATITAGDIQSTPIGTNLRESGGFTTLSASDLFDVSDPTESTSQTTGAAVITGGLGVGKAINANGPVWINDLGATETKLTGYSLVLQGDQAKLRVGPNYTAGAADFIDIKTQSNNPTIVTTSDNFTIENTKNASLITLTATAGSVAVSANTASTDKITGALTVVGGIGVGQQVHANDMYVYGQTGLSNTASQVVSVGATQTITNKTLTAPVLNNSVLTGTIQAGASVGIQGQLLSSTGTGVAWVNPVSFSAVGYAKVTDQNINPSGDVSWPAGSSFTIGSSFGSMDASGIFTFTVTGTYQVTINFSITDINGGSTYPPADAWIKKNNSNSVKYCQILTNGVRRGSVTEVIDFAANDTLIWFMNSVIRVNGGTATGSRLTIVRLY